MRVLIVDNNIDPKSWGAGDLVACAVRSSGAIVTVRRAPQMDIPDHLESYDRFMVSGSLTSATEQAPWVGRLEDAIRSILDLGRPLLGICFGHQLIARTLGGLGSVRKSPTPEYGWTEIERTDPSSLFDGLPPRFYSFSSHFDEVHVLPKELRATARSEECGVQAFQMGDRPVYGIQFHPEKPLESGEAALVERRRIGTPKKLLNAGRGRKLFDPTVSEKIFGNFLK